MSSYDSSDDLAAYLQAAGVDCTLIEDGFIKVPILEHDYVATVRVEGSWVVFKMFVGDWGDDLHQSTFRSLLLINQRLLGFRFSAERGDVWVQEEFPVGILNEQFHNYLFHAIDVLSTVIPPLVAFFESGTLMGDDDIDAVFDLIAAQSDLRSAT